MSVGRRKNGEEMFLFSVVFVGKDGEEENLLTLLSTYIYIYVCVCVCVSFNLMKCSYFNLNETFDFKLLKSLHQPITNQSHPNKCLICVNLIIDKEKCN